MDKKIKIIYLINTFLFGGAQKMVLDLASYLDKDKFEVIVFSLKQNDLTTHKYYDAKSRAAKYNFRFVDMPNQKNNLALIKNLILFFKQEKPDILHCHLPWAVIVGTVAGRLTGVKKIIIHEHNTHKFYSKKIRCLTFVLRRLASLTICYSPEVEQEIFSRNNPFSLSTEKIAYNSYTIPNGVDLQEADDTRARLDRSAKRQSLGLAPDRVVVLSAARLLPWKGQANLIRAMARAGKENKDIVLLIAGSGMEDAPLRQLAKDLELGKDQVVFLGPRSDVPEIMAAADIFSSVLSYPPDFVSESIGLSTLEAMAFALPVIVGDYPGVAKVIQDQVNGLVISPNNEQQLAETILSLASKPSFRQALGKAARQSIADNFSWSHLALVYQKLYKLVAEN